MCGICAYAGHDADAVIRVFEGLKKLEYRGYDSWGIAWDEKGLGMIKKVGKVSAFTDARNLGKSTIAIGHTRWATHGGVNEINAHPHASISGRWIVVHNGVVENYTILKEKLVKKGITFHTETDTEAIANWLEWRMHETHDSLTSLRETANILEGRNAFAVFDRKEKQLFAVRIGSPLMLGKGRRGYYIVSDPNPFLSESRKAIFLDDGEIAQADADGFLVISAKTSQTVTKKITTLHVTPESLSLDNYPHFFLKEVNEQPNAIAVSLEKNRRQLTKAATLIHNAFQVFLIGAGTAGKVAIIGSYLLAEIGKRQTTAVTASEFSLYVPFVDKKTLVLAISQSGETADTLEAITQAKKAGAKIVSLVNVESSTLARESNLNLFMKTGIEKAVASTKATTTPIALLTALSYHCVKKPAAGGKLITAISKAAAEFLDSTTVQKIRTLASQLQHQENIYIIGRGISYPVALESAIKLQELSCIHAEGLAGGELKHYAISLIEHGTPAIVLAPNDETKAEIISNALEIKARGGFIIGVSPKKEALFDEWIDIADLGKFGSPIISLLPMQLLAYHLALIRGFDPDYCRNLAKSVTVK